MFHHSSPSQRQLFKQFFPDAVVIYSPIPNKNYQKSMNNKTDVNTKYKYSPLAPL